MKDFDHVLKPSDHPSCGTCDLFRFYHETSVAGNCHLNPKLLRQLQSSHFCSSWQYTGKILGQSGTGQTDFRVQLKKYRQAQE